MDFTFGIITKGDCDNNIEEIIKSIEINNIPNYEIIIVGNSSVQITDKITVIKFDENIKQNWITRKKNIVIENSKYENLVIMHDYIKLDEEWYKGFLCYGNEFEFCINKIKNLDGTRHRDYLVSPYYFNEISNYFEKNCYLPYYFVNTKETNNFLYISGAYLVIKKKIALETKLNEKLCWNQGEDIVFCQDLNDKNVIIKFNPYSTVKLMKYKGLIYFEKEIQDKNELEKFINIYSKNPIWKFDEKSLCWIRK
jgi:hypothetical protein